MEDGYRRDLKTVTLDMYAEELGTSELLPSRKMLQEDTRERFHRLEGCGVRTLEDVLSALSNPAKLRAFAAKSGLPEEYLAVLKREVASLLPKPIKLKDFPRIGKDAVSALETIGIITTKDLFPFVRDGAGRRALSERTGIPHGEILETAKLTDVSRIRWVGANFARLLVDSSCDTVEKIARADYRALYAELRRINTENSYFRGMFGEHDMKLCVLEAGKTHHGGGMVFSDTGL